MDKQNVGCIVRLCLIYAIIHSGMAANTVKEFTARLVGRRQRDGMYRAVYTLQSVGFLIFFGWRITRMPDRELYRVPPPASYMLYALQAIAIALGVYGAVTMNFAAFLGLPQLRKFIKGQHIGAAPIAEEVQPVAVGVFKTGGPTRFMRHPVNLAQIGLAVFTPRMTVNRATVAAMIALYNLLGGLHEEYRLRKVYGTEYARYQKDVPYLLPKIALT